MAKQWGITKEEQDNFALASQHKCEAAQKGGHFKEEIVPVIVQSRDGKQYIEKMFSKIDKFAGLLNLGFLVPFKWHY